MHSRTSMRQFPPLQRPLPGAAHIRTIRRALCPVALALVCATAVPAGATPDDEYSRAVADARAGLHPSAITRLERLHRAHPDDPRYLHDLVTVHAWAGEAEGVLRLLPRLDPARLPVFVLEAAAPVLYQAGHLTEALALYQERELRDPTDAATAVAIVAIARDLGAASEALARARQIEDLLPPGAVTDLALDLAAHHVREAHRVAPARRGPAVEQALEALARAGDGVADLPAAHRTPRARRAAMDRLVALASARDWSGILALHDELLADMVPLPAYVQAVAAAAHLQLRQPERAADLFRQALAVPSPATDHGWETGYFHALLESERWPEAWRRINDLLDRTPAFLAEYHPGTRRPNPRYVDVLATRAMALAYGNRHAEAEAALQAVWEQAPFSTSVRLERARLALFRGRPRAARDALERLRADVPDDAGVHAWLGAAHSELGEWDEARRSLAQAEILDPGLPTVHAAGRTLYGRSMWRFEGASGLDQSPDDAGQDGSSTELQYWLWSPVLGEGPVSLGIGTRHRHGRVDGTSVRLRRYGAGLTHRAGGWEVGLRLELEQPEGRLSPELEIRHRPRDAWSWRGHVRHHDWARPLRAATAGIRMDSHGLGLHYHPDESLHVGLNAAFSRFSDGNRRGALSLDVAMQLHADHRQHLLGLAGVGISHASLRDTPYFNPARDTGVWAGLRWQHSIARRYEREWTQRLELRAGGYGQSEHGWGPVWEMQYGQHWQFHRDHGVMLSLRAGRRPWDGRQEWNLGARLQLELRF